MLVYQRVRGVGIKQYGNRWTLRNSIKDFKHHRIMDLVHIGRIWEDFSTMGFAIPKTIDQGLSAGFPVDIPICGWLNGLNHEKVWATVR